MLCEIYSKMLKTRTKFCKQSRFLHSSSLICHQNLTGKVRAKMNHELAKHDIPLHLVLWQPHVQKTTNANKRKLQEPPQFSNEAIRNTTPNKQSMP